MGDGQSAHGLTFEPTTCQLPQSGSGLRSRHWPGKVWRTLAAGSTQRQEGREQAWQEISKDATLVWETITLERQAHPQSDQDRVTSAEEGEQGKPEEPEGSGGREGFLGGHRCREVTGKERREHGSGKEREREWGNTVPETI